MSRVCWVGCRSYKRRSALDAAFVRLLGHLVVRTACSTVAEVLMFLNKSKEVVVTKNMQLSLGHGESIAGLKLEQDFF